MSKNSGKRSLLGLLLALFMVLYSLPVSAGELSVETDGTGSEIAAHADFETAYEGVLQYLQNEVTPGVGSTYGEWAVLALARAGIIDKQSDWAQTYLAALDDALENEDLIGSTDFERVTLAVTALGLDAEHYNGQDLTEVYKTYNKRMALNSKTFALISLNSRPYSGDSEIYVQALLDAALPGGGWTLYENGGADTDVTAMAIQALAPYYKENAQVAAAVDSGLSRLKSRQEEETGGFEGMEGANSACSAAQVIVALTAMEIDPASGEWTTGAGCSVLDALLTHYNSENGCFGELDSADQNQMATEQAAYALTAYRRFLDDRSSLYDMSDTDSDPSAGDGSENEGDEENNQELPGEDSDGDKDSEGTSSGEAAEDEDSGSQSGDADGVRITVYFTLLGDEKHNSDQDGSVHTLAGRNLETWIGKNAVQVPENSYVMDVFAASLKEKGYSWMNDSMKNGTDGNYIQSITTPQHVTIGEFTNGELSGWMYTLNGTHPLYGVNAQKVRDGDEIVFHYTDDYTAEEHSGVWSSDDEETGSDKNTASDDEKTDIEEKKPDDDDQSMEERSGEATEAPKPAMSFTDVKDGDWYYEAVRYAFENGWMDGEEDMRFNPDGTLNRAMLVTILYRIEGQPKTVSAHSFADVGEDLWYTDAVSWANETGIAEGYGEGMFGPDDAVTREQLAAILYRYAGSPKEGRISLADFSDADMISDYAADAVMWAAANGILSGKEDHILDPAGNATRAEAAAILQRYRTSRN